MPTMLEGRLCPHISVHTSFSQEGLNILPWVLLIPSDIRQEELQQRTVFTVQREPLGTSHRKRATGNQPLETSNWKPATGNHDGWLSGNLRRSLGGTFQATLVCVCVSVCMCVCVCLDTRFSSLAVRQLCKAGSAEGCSVLHVQHAVSDHLCKHGGPELVKSFTFEVGV